MTIKEAYPNYKTTSLKLVYDGLSKKNQKVISDFIDYCLTTASERSIIKIYGKIVQIADIFQKDLDTLNLEDIRAFLKLLNGSDRAIETQNDTKKILKRFLKFQFDDWSKKFKNFEDNGIKTKDGMNHQKLNATTILTQDEIYMLVNSIESLKYKSLILLMYESAGRPEEVLKLTWGDIDLEKGQVKLASSKTGKTRVNPIQESLDNLKRYKLECFFPTARNTDYLFPNPNHKEKYMTSQALSDYLNKVKKRINFKKHIFPYILRHTRLTELIKKLSPKVYEQFAGHSLETGMKIYAHLNTDDVQNEMNEKIFKIEELTKEDNKKIKELEEEILKLTKSQKQTTEMIVKIANKLNEKGLLEDDKKIKIIHLDK